MGGTLTSYRELKILNEIIPLIAESQAYTIKIRELINRKGSSYQHIIKNFKKQIPRNIRFRVKEESTKSNREIISERLKKPD